MALIDELRSEVKRIALREIRAQIKPTRTLLASHRHHIANLRRQIASLERDVARLSKAKQRVETAPVEASETPTGRKTRFNGTAWRAYRERAGVSAKDISELLGVSLQTIYNYELGATTPRPEQAAALAELKKMGVRELRNRVAKA